MKRILLLCAVAVLSVATSIDASAGRFGIKGAMNVTSLQLDDFNSINALGYSAGLTWQWNLPLWLAIQPDLLYHVRGSKLDDVGSKLSIGTVELVPNIQWGPRFAKKNARVFVQASPFVGYAVSKNAADGRGFVSPDVQGILDQYGVKGDWTNINRFTYGCGVGLGVQLWFLQVTAQYVWNFGSVADFSGMSIDSFNETNFSGGNVTLALMFGKKKNKDKNNNKQ